MSAIGTTYSFKDLSGAFATPFGNLTFGGQIGMGTVTVTNATDHTAHDLAADGTIMPSFVPGDGGTVTIECQQTSIVHKFLLDWLNSCKTASMNGDLSSWAASTLYLHNTLDGSTHNVGGISPVKSPDKVYAAQGAKITWTLQACDVTNQ
jgi:hypothetical protein